MLGDAANGSCPAMLASEARPKPPQIPFSDEEQVTVTALQGERPTPESKTPEHQVRTSLSPTDAGDFPPLCSLSVGGGGTIAALALTFLYLSVYFTMLWFSQVFCRRTL